MLYAMSGKGSMPPKEAAMVLAQLLKEAEADAVARGVKELDFWMALDQEKIGSDERMWGAVSRWADENDVFIADTGDLKSLMIEAQQDDEDDRVVLLALPVSPDFTADEDYELCTVVDACMVMGIPVKCFNGQMYTVELGKDDEPSEDVAEMLAAMEQDGTLGDLVAAVESGDDRAIMAAAVAVDAPPKGGRKDMEAMSRTELKQIAEEIGANPVDWRAKSNIIDAIIAVRDAPPAEEPPTPPAPAVEEPVERAQEPLEAAGPDREWVRAVVREELVSVLTDLLNSLLVD